MSMNKVQFQKGMSLADFMAQYDTEQHVRVMFFKYVGLRGSDAQNVEVKNTVKSGAEIVFSANTAIIKPPYFQSLSMSKLNCHSITGF